MPVATTDDLEKLKLEILQQTAPATIQNDVDRLNGWRRKLDVDSSFGRIFSGPQWLDKVAIRDGNITAAKLEANLVISNTFISGGLSPADRMELDALGLRAYGVVSGVANTKTLDIHKNGNFEFGDPVGGQVTFVASTGVLTVPSAVIAGLTIADVGSGTLGGTYGTGGAGARIELSTAGIRAYNTTPTQTFFLDAANGNMTMVGNFTIASDLAASSRLSMTQAGIQLWKAGNNEFSLQAGGVTNSVAMLLRGAGAGQYIGMQPDTGLWLGASTFAGAPFSVTNAGALVATGVTVTGAVNATSGTFTGNVNINSGGSLTMNGGVIRTGSGNPRLEIDSTGLYAYNSSGVVTAQIGSSGYGYLGNLAITWGLTGGVVTTTVGSWIATTTGLTDSTGATGMSGNGVYSFWAGSVTPSSAPFSVKPNGDVVATSATISGAITSTSGTIGGWTLSSTKLTGGNVELNSTGVVRVGINASSDWAEMSATDANYRLWVGTSSSATAPFRVSPTGALTASNATVTGSITASSGSITGTLTMGSSGLIRITAAGSGKMEIDASGIFMVNTSGVNTGWIKADGTGFLGRIPITYPNGTIIWDSAGVVTVAGWTLSDTEIHSGATTSYTAMSTGTYAFWSGAVSAASAPFSVTATGDLTSKSGQIGGFFIDSTGLSLGSGTTTRGISTNASYAFYAGNTIASGLAKFKVSSAGALTATDATITGAVTATSGSFTGALTATSLSITGTASFSGGTLTLPNGGSITSTTVDINGNSSGAGTFGNMTVDGTVTVNGGNIILASGGSYGDVIKWQSGGVDRGSIFTVGAGIYVVGGTSGSNWKMQADTGGIALLNGAATIALSGASGGWAVTPDFYITDGSSLAYLRLDRTGTGMTGAMPNPTNYIQVKDSGGSIRRIPTFANSSPWAA